MGRRHLFFLVIVLMLPIAAWAQAGQVLWEYVTTGGAPLDTTCAGPTHIPDGWIIKVFWDNDSNGPDPADQQPAICTAPPACNSGPQYTVSFNRFTTNGTDQGYGDGYFLANAYMKIASNVPPVPRYYLRIYSPADTTVAVWTSAVKTVHSGAQTVAFLHNEWTCTPPTPQCVVKDAHE